jgi:hypothetical protein
MHERPLNYESRADQAKTQSAADGPMPPLAEGAIIFALWLLIVAAAKLAAAGAPMPGVLIVEWRAVTDNPAMWGLIAYPLVYLSAAAASIHLSRSGRPRAAGQLARLPLLYTLGILFAFVVFAMR